MRLSLSNSLAIPLRAVLIVIGLTAGGCTYVPHHTIASVGGVEAGQKLDDAPDPQRVVALADEFQHLSPAVDPKEADAVARIGVYYSEQLAESFGMVKPVELHNVLVNLHLRPGGLCYQFAENLLAELNAQHFKTVEFHRSIAWKGKLFDEHNCVVVTAAGQPFETGIVLDAWRNAGHLRWAPVAKDYYPWVPKPDPSEAVATGK